jgi:hypothetical protein
MSANPAHCLSHYKCDFKWKAPAKKQNPPSTVPPRWATCAAIFVIPYRAIPPHSGALLQQQQKQAPIINLWFTGLKLSYSGTLESQFARGLLRIGKGERNFPAPPVVTPIMGTMEYGHVLSYTCSDTRGR